jgi:hypothetical protein
MAQLYWKKALFVLKPVSLSRDDKSLVLQFFWLKHSKINGEVDMLKKPVLPSDYDSPDIELVNCVTGRKIRSGDMITLTTTDPVNLPLPDYDLLDMQWVLNRVCALSGDVDMTN